MRTQTLVLFGRSGSGKGTQADLLIKYIEDNDPGKRKVLLMEIGKQLREFSEQDNHTARLTEEIVHGGGLVPEFITIWAWTNLFIQKYSGKEHLILDGFSRQPNEALVLGSALKFYGCKRPIIILINISTDAALERLHRRGRSDDSVDKIKTRTEWFDTHVVSALEYYRNTDGYKIIEIDGEQSIEQVHQDLIRAIDWKDE